jgi:hypothetical protein
MLILGRIKSRVKNSYFNFVSCQGKWLIPLEVILHIAFKLPCHVVLTRYELGAQDVLANVLVENLYMIQGQSCTSIIECEIHFQTSTCCANCKHVEHIKNENHKEFKLPK